MLRRARYVVALQQDDLHGALTGVLAIGSVLKPIMEAGVKDGLQLRMPTEGLKHCSADEIMAGGQSEMLQSALVDILLCHALTKTWDTTFEAQLLALVRQEWGGTSLLQPLLDASSGRYAVGASASRLVVVAWFLRLLRQDAGLNPALRFNRDLHLISHVAASFARDFLERRVVAEIEAGWRSTIANQRFALVRPNRGVPLLEGALAAFSNKGLRAARGLFEASASMVDAQLSPEWHSFLTRLEASTG
jgi:hypothetical protein